MLRTQIRIYKSLLNSQKAILRRDGDIKSAQLIHEIENNLSQILKAKDIVPIGLAKKLKEIGPIDAEKWYFVGRDGGYSIKDKPKKITKNYYPAVYMDDLYRYF